MKRFTTILLVVATAALSLASCKKNENKPEYIATATLKAVEDGSFFLKLNDSTVLVPNNAGQNPYKGVVEHRCRAIYMIESKEPGLFGFKNGYKIALEAIDTIYTKPTAASLGELDDEVYGKDEVGLFLEGSGVFPYTELEDGYLTVSFAFPSTGSGIIHNMYLVTGVDEEDPYTLEFRHNAGIDIVGSLYSGCMAFPLKDLPDTGGKTVKLTLRWNSLDTHKTESIQFNYCSRTDWPQ